MWDTEFTVSRLSDEAFCQALAATANVGVGHATYSRVQPSFDTRWRYVPVHFLHLVTEGALLARFADHSLQVEPGQALWTRCAVGHRLSLAPAERERTRCYALQLWVTLPDRTALRPSPDYLHVERADTLREAFDRLTLRDPHGGVSADYVTRAQLLELVARWLQGGASSGAVEAFTPTQVRLLQRYLHDHLADNPSVADLAALLDLSQAYFSDRFRAHFGEAPRAWLTRERIRRAAVMLVESPLRVRAVAAAVGFTDQRFFARQFRRQYGLSPRDYRRQRTGR